VRKGEKQGNLPASWSLYVITDRGSAKGRSHEFVAMEALRGGADAIQLRDKHASPRSLLLQALKVRSVTEKEGKPLLINDRIDIALAAKAEGAHIGFDDFDYTRARKIVRPPFILGMSAGSVKELREAVMGNPDYIGVGPIFEARETKADAGDPVGLEFIEVARSMTDIPLIAIGGIDHGNAPSVIRAGALGIAVISSVVGADDISQSARRLKECVEEARAKYH